MELKQWVYLEAYGCYFMGRVPYCAMQEVPVQQCMNIYVPAAYLHADGSPDFDGICRGYTAKSAPVVFENGLAGYMEAEPFDINDPRGAAKDFLNAGFVYVSCGCRGRSSVNAQGVRCGKSPLSLVDLKAGIRFLRAHREELPGNMDRIVSVGISAGGAMSTLLGCTGNSENYTAELSGIGAVMDEPDDIFAAQCYCPIIDLDHADFAYEWMFEGKRHYDGMVFVGFPEGDFDAYCSALSDAMGQVYAEYFNGFGLTHPKTGKPIEIAVGRKGSGAEFLREKLEQSATKFLAKLEKKELPIQASVTDYLHGNYMAQKFDPGQKKLVSVPGIDKSAWLSWDGKRASITSLDDMLGDYHRRLKLCPAFDDLNLIQAENQEFGTPECDKMHFDAGLPAVMESLQKEFPEETKRYLPGYQAVIGDEGLARRRYLINPLNYIGTEEQADLAPHYRIRVGSRDADTSLTVTMLLALRLLQTGRTDVDYEIVWDEPHGRADYPGEVTEWIRKICE